MKDTKSILVVTLDDDGEANLHLNQYVPTHVANTLIEADGKSRHENGVMAMRVALGDIELEEGEGFLWAPFMNLFEACELAPQSKIPAVDHHIRFYLS